MQSVQKTRRAPLKARPREVTDAEFEQAVRDFSDRSRRHSNTLPVEPLWLSYERLLKIHDVQIERFGGVPGVKDRNLVQSA